MPRDVASGLQMRPQVCHEEFRDRGREFWDAQASLIMTAEQVLPFGRGSLSHFVRPLGISPVLILTALCKPELQQ